MKYHFIKQNSCPTDGVTLSHPVSNKHSLLLIFTGWASDERLFKNFSEAKQDVCICSDYRTLEFDAELFRSYSEIRVIAWSLGVFVANRVLLNSALPVVSAVAINGTIFPRNDEKGIPTAIYDGTEQILTEENLFKFYRRMCVSAEDYRNFLKFGFSFPVTELQDALQNIRIIEEKEPSPCGKTIFTEVIIGLYDRIFPTKNQKQAWENFPSVKFKEIAHYDEQMFNIEEVNN